MTKLCDYCGKENEVTALHCAECGTAFPAVEAPPSEDSPRLDAKKAFTILVLYIVAQNVILILAGAAGTALLGGRGPEVPSQSTSLPFNPRVLGPAIFLSVFGGGVAMLFTALKLIPNHLRDHEPSGAAWRIGPRRNLVVGFGFGIGTCLAYAIISGVYVQLTGYMPPLSPITSLASSGTFNLVLWIVMLCLGAPLIEEALFRGIVFAGFQNSWGRIPGAAATSLAFWLLHLGEMAQFWPAMVGIGAMAVLTLWLRLRYAAIGPAIAAHFGYNGFIAFILLLSRLGQEG